MRKFEKSEIKSEEPTLKSSFVNKLSSVFSYDDDVSDENTETEVLDHKENPRVFWGRDGFQNLQGKIYAECLLLKIWILS